MLERPQPNAPRIQGRSRHPPEKLALTTAASIAPLRIDMRSTGEALARTRQGTLQGLRLLALLRTFAPVAQALTLLVVTQHFSVHVPLGAIVMLLMLEVAIAVATWLRVLRAPQVSEFELFAQAQLDIALFAAVLYLTGGATNPFAPLFVLPMAIAASALRPRWVWITAASTMVAYALLREFHVPLFHPRGETEVYQLHEDGMVVNYLFTAALLAYFCNRMHAAQQQHERVLAQARDAQMRSESVVAIGALAAGYAHELSSPLGTMAVVVAELQREHHDNPRLLQELRVIDDQIKASKQIVSNLANAGGQRRAETAAGARLDRFLLSIVERARALHPGASMTVRLDTTTPPPWIVAEETLRQTITNLIDNAVRASPQHVELSADWTGPELHVAVRDRGPGFDAEVLQQLGRRIGTSKGGHGGMGLGLLLSMATLERLGGALELGNEPDGGARASIRIPLQTLTIDANRSPPDGNAPL